MVEVRLHGELAREFGKIWHLAIDTAREAVDAIEANKPGFINKIRDLERRGMVFRVRARDHDYDNDDVNMPLGSRKRVDIIPIVAGASAGVRFVIGAVLTVVGAYFSNPYVVQAGITLMLGSVVQWLTPVPKKNQFTALDSWTISGPTNTVEQGKPVPVIYGEVLTGGYTVSAGLSASDLSTFTASNPSVAIGGDVNPTVSPQSGHTSGTCVVMLSASANGLSGNLTYSWTVNSFTTQLGVIPNPTVTVSGQGTATIKLTIAYTGATRSANFIGNVSVTVHGTNSAGASSAPSATTQVNVTLQPISFGF